MRSGVLSPLAAWLTQRTLPRARRSAAFGLGLGALMLLIGAWAWLVGDLFVLQGLLLLSLLVLLLIPPVAAALAAAQTALELRGEHFQFLLMTTLPERVMVEGLLYAALYRTRYLRALAVGVMPAFILGWLAEYMRFMMSLQVMYYNQLDVLIPPDIIIPTFLLVGVVLFLWSLNLAAVRLGVAVALRWRSAALGAVLAPVLMLLVIASPVLVILNLAWGPLVCFAAPFVYIWIGQLLWGTRLVRHGSRWIRQG